MNHAVKAAGRRVSEPKDLRPAKRRDADAAVITATRIRPCSFAGLTEQQKILVAWAYEADGTPQQTKLLREAQEIAGGKARDDWKRGQRRTQLSDRSPHKFG